MYVQNTSDIHTLTRELKISYTLEVLTSVFTHWYWSMITVTLDSRIRPIAMHHTQCTYTYFSLTGYEPQLALTNPYTLNWNILTHSYLESTYPCLSKIVDNTTGSGT